MARGGDASIDRGSHLSQQSMTIVAGSANVYADLGFDAEEAANLKVRADLMLKLRQYIQDSGLTQEQAAEFFSETQPRISNLMSGEISRFSVDKLINMLVRAGMDVQVSVSAKAA